MTEGSTRTVIVGYDEGEQSKDALALGELLCGTLDGKLVLASVYPWDPRLRTPAYEQERAEARASAESLLREAPLSLYAERNVERVALPSSSPAHGLYELALERDAALVVLGSVHRGTLNRVVPGSVATKLLHGAPCPVAVAPVGYAQGAPHELQTVAAAFDGNEESAAAVELAARLAVAAGAALRVVAVVDTFGAMYIGLERGTVLNVVERELRERLERLVGRLPAESRSEQRVLRGPVTRTLLGEVEEGVDLLVLGSRGYGAIGSVFLGSVSGDLVRQAPCPVLVAPRQSA
jgi:nucleotide-binding universal stress UspA family protein